MSTMYGKIASLRYGFGGYDDAMFGLTVVLEGKGWGVTDFIGFWPLGYPRSEHAKWTDEEQSLMHLLTIGRITDLLRETNRRGIDELVGTPIVAVFDDAYKLVSWRILTEVL